MVKFWRWTKIYTFYTFFVKVTNWIIFFVFSQNKNQHWYIKAMLVEIFIIWWIIQIVCRWRTSINSAVVFSVFLNFMNEFRQSTINLNHIYVNKGLGIEWEKNANCILKHFRIFPKIMRAAIVAGFGSRQLL